MTTILPRPPSPPSPPSTRAHMQPTLTIEPSATEILRLARQRFAHIDERGRRLRAQLGLPTDRPIVMSGHQLAVWHPGILAKWLFTAAAAETEGFAAAWVWVDQDANRYADIAFPLRTDAGVLKKAVWRAAPPGRQLGPVCGEAPFEPTPAPEPSGAAFAAAQIGPALLRIREALAGAAPGAANAAEQVERAVSRLLEPLESPVPHRIFATALARTDLFAELVARMRERPRECTDAYNAAVAAYPDGHGAEVSMLNTGVGAEVRARGPELPLWRLVPRASGGGAARVHAHAADLEGAPLAELAPRGLMMTGLLRLGACDVFIHGTGGGGPAGYDRITDLWLAKWLGATLAPTAVVSATMRLDLGEPEEQPTPQEARRARWLAHHARHHPSLIGDAAAAARKRELLEAIRRSPRNSAERAALFREMHALLDRVNAEHATALERLDREAEVAEARLGNAAVAGERTWPFPLYPAADLAALREMVRRAVGGR